MSEPHANPIRLKCRPCGFAWENTIWLPLEAGRFVKLLKAMSECPKCHAHRKGDVAMPFGDGDAAPPGR